jgi:hypothetical protein
LESITDIIDTISRMPVEYAYPLYQACVNTSLPPFQSISAASSTNAWTELLP